MKRSLNELRLRLARLDQQYVRLLLAAATLGLLVLGAGAPSDPIGP